MSQDILERLQAWLSQETVETDPAAVVREAAKEIKRLRDQWEIRGHVMDSIADLFVKPRWIPVGERLPEEGDRVLFYNASDEHQYARMVRVGRCIDDGPTGHMELRIVDFAAPSAIATHWMPLPEPPKQKSLATSGAST